MRESIEHFRAGSPQCPYPISVNDVLRHLRTRTKEKKKKKKEIQRHSFNWLLRLIRRDLAFSVARQREKTKAEIVKRKNAYRMVLFLIWAGRWESCATR